MTDVELKVGQVWSISTVGNKRVRIISTSEAGEYPVKAERLDENDKEDEILTYTSKGKFIDSEETSPLNLDKLLYDNEDEENPYDCGPEQEPTESIQEVLACEKDLAHDPAVPVRPPFVIDDAVEEAYPMTIAVDLAKEGSDTTILAQAEAQSLELAASERIPALCVGDDTDYTTSTVPARKYLRILNTRNGWVVSDAGEYNVGNEWVFNNQCKLAEFIHDYFTTEEVKED